MTDNVHDNDPITTAINIAATYYANWQLANAEFDSYNISKYHCMFDAARVICAVFGIDEQTIIDAARSQYGAEIAKAQEESFPSF